MFLLAATQMQSMMDPSCILTTGLVPNMHQACQEVLLLMSDPEICVEDTEEVFF